MAYTHFRSIFHFPQVRTATEAERTISLKNPQEMLLHYDDDLMQENADDFFLLFDNIFLLQ